MAEIEKAESTAKTITASLLTEHGQPRLVNSKWYLNESRRKELQPKNALYTFDCMTEDDAVSSALTTTLRPATKAIWAGSWKGTGSVKSAVAAEFLNYNIQNMESSTWMGAVKNILTCLKYGFSLQNIVLHKKGYGQWANSWTLKKLAPRDQKTVYAWLYDENNREVLGFVQRPIVKNTVNDRLFDPGGISLDSTYNGFYTYRDTKFVVIKKQNCTHFTYDGTNNNPTGDSPLNHCYKAWKEKSLIEQYEVIGVTKDLGGVMILRVPEQLVEEAETDPTGRSADEYRAVQTDTAKLATGEGNLMVFTSELAEGGQKYMYDLEIKGIEGGGKQYNTSAIIDQKRKAIYNSFGAGYVLLGQDGGGSFALSTAGTTTHGYFVEDLVNQCVDVLQSQLAPRILAANGQYLNYRDFPVFQPADPDELDLDVMSKVVQRVGSVKKLTPKLLEQLIEKAGFSSEGVDELDFSAPQQSGAGKGMATAGPGTSLEPGGGDASISNNENMASKSLFKVDEHKDQLVFSDEAGNLSFIDKEDLLDAPQ